MPIISSLANIAAKAYGMMANAKRIITDTFNRSDGSLGTSTSGHPWSVLRGTWAISSSQATSSTAGSSYPLASVDLGAQNVIVSADITDGGPGVAFWVTDANSWWASSVDYQVINTPAVYGTTCCQCTGPSTTNAAIGCGTFTPSSSSCGTKVGSGDCNYQGAYYPASTVQTCPAGKSYISSQGDCCEVGIVGGSVYYFNCGGVSYPCTGPSTTNAATGCPYLIPAQYTGTTVTTPASYSASQQSYSYLVSNAYDTYYTNLKIYSSVSGTITTAATLTLNSNTSGYSEANSIKVTTSGESISAQAFSSAGLSSQLGSTLTHNATGANRGTKTGIVKTPSTANAGSVLDNFATENVL